MSSIWTPHLTVAAIIELQGQYLLIEEESGGKAVLNQPAGHVEEGESLIEAVQREVREEACRHFEPQYLCGIYRWCNPDSGVTYLRAAFVGTASELDPQLERDSAIISDGWWSRDALGIQPLRSPLVSRCMDDHHKGIRLPLDLIQEIES